MPLLLAVRDVSDCSRSIAELKPALLLGERSESSSPLRAGPATGRGDGAANGDGAPCSLDAGRGVEDERCWAEAEARPELLHFHWKGAHEGFRQMEHAGRARARGQTQEGPHAHGACKPSMYRTSMHVPVDRQAHKHPLGNNTPMVPRCRCATAHLLCCGAEAPAPASTLLAAPSAWAMVVGRYPLPTVPGSSLQHTTVQHAAEACIALAPCACELKQGCSCNSRNTCPYTRRGGKVQRDRRSHLLFEKSGKRRCADGGLREADGALCGSRAASTRRTSWQAAAGVPSQAVKAGAHTLARPSTPHPWSTTTGLIARTTQLELTGAAVVAGAYIR